MRQPNIHRDPMIPCSDEHQEAKEGSADESGSQIYVLLMLGLAE